MKNLEVKYRLSLGENDQTDVLDEVFDRIFSKVWTTLSGESQTTTSGSDCVGNYTNSGTGNGYLSPSTCICAPNDRRGALTGQADYLLSLTTYSNYEIAPWNLIIN